MKLVEENRFLYAVKDEKYYRVSNVWLQHDGWHLVHGWYVHPEPININADYEIDITDQYTCRVIK